jgi:hypothetical protein
VGDVGECRQPGASPRWTKQGREQAAKKFQSVQYVKQTRPAGGFLWFSGVCFGLFLKPIPIFVVLKSFEITLC